jgi:hypothetical protein
MEQIVIERIRELLKLRNWYRTNRWADWPDLRKEAELELRALVRLARAARKAEAAKPDPMDEWKSYADWAAWQAAGPR